jgi:predicted DNA-binding transcriptional regulator AlpA
MSPSEAPPATKYLTPKAAAKLVGVTTQTLRAWHNDPANTFPRPYAVTDRSLRYDEAEILAYLRCHRWVARVQAGECAAAAEVG